jgi:hypothetical protein
VPPQTAGNGPEVTRSVLLQTETGMKRGRPLDGGVWVLGLCQRCNHASGRRTDTPYAEFANAVRPFLRPSAGRSLLDPFASPDVMFAPGLVAQAVMFGMHAINPRLREIFPTMASDLKDIPSGMTLPEGARLWVALMRGHSARIAGPIGYHRVLYSRSDLITFAEIFFPPFAWILTAPGQEHMQFLQEERWADASDWVRYDHGRTSVDLRNLAPRLPVVKAIHDRHDADGWLSMYSDEITPVLEGKLPA